MYVHRKVKKDKTIEIENPGANRGPLLIEKPT